MSTIDNRETVSISKFTLYYTEEATLTEQLVNVVIRHSVVDIRIIGQVGCGDWIRASQWSHETSIIIRLLSRRWS